MVDAANRLRYPRGATIQSAQEGLAVRIESSITSISWIPSEAIPGVMRLPFDLGPMHYDDPPGDQLGDVATLAKSGAVRFINELRVWIDVDHGKIAGQDRKSVV